MLGFGVQDYAIVAPSMGRVHLMPRFRAMFPTAIICVNDNEADAYAAVVPKDKLLVHPPMRLIETRNWILDNVQAETVVQVNDDVRGVLRVTQPARTIRNPDSILCIIENMVQMTRDLDLGVFTFSLSSNDAMLHTWVRPFRPAVPVSAHCFGMRGPARYRYFDPKFIGQGDYDFTFKTLLEDRLVVGDLRFVFDCGKMSTGAGGNTGQFSSELYQETRATLRAKWGHYMGPEDVQSWKRKEGAAMSVRVRRSSVMALK